jgi:hypothetical protein
MSRKKIFLFCSTMALLSAASLLTCSTQPNYIQTQGSTPIFPAWISAMEFITPVLITGLVLILHSILRMQHPNPNNKEP